MGGSPSKTRKLTVENDDPTSVIKVSEGVVDRIRGNQLVRQDVHPSPSPGIITHSQPGPFITAPLFWNEPSLTTIQLRQEHVGELKKNDEYWENRMKSLEANHKQMNEIMEEEYHKACDQVGGRSSTVESKPICQDKKWAVMECYREYRREPMRCAKVVQAFQECVDLKRTQIIANRG